MHKVSIIVPCYKQAEYLPETLDSVLSQNYSNWECVIVNDGSPDNTEEVARCYLEKDPRFKYVKQENRGVSSARNSGIANSNGEFILPLDSDDLIAPSYLEKCIDRFISSPETKLVYCKAEKFGKEKGIWDLPPYHYDSFIWDNCIFCSAMFKRIDYEITGGYNENMVNGNEDWDFWLTFLKKDDVVYRIDEVLFFYRVKDVSRTTMLTHCFNQENLIQLCKNHSDIYDPYKERVVLYHKQVQELSALNEELDRVRHSRAFRLGKFLLKPFSWIKK